MKNVRFLLMLFVLIGALALPSLACGVLRPIDEDAPIQTPVAPAPDSEPTSRLVIPTAVAMASPIASPATASVRPTAVPTLASSPTAPQSAITPAAVLPVETEEAPPAGPLSVVVTEDDIAEAISSDVLSQNGLTGDNLQVRFTGGRVRITASRLSYGPVQVNNLVLVGRLVAVDGALQMETESVTPPGLVTALIPTFVNQALKQYAEQWYIEDVTVSEGQMVLKVR